MAIIKLKKAKHKECHDFRTYSFNCKLYTGRNPLDIVIMTRTEEGNIPLERKVKRLGTIPKRGDIIYIDKEIGVRKFLVTGHIFNTMGNRKFGLRFLNAVFLEVNELKLDSHLN